MRQEQLTFVSRHKLKLALKMLKEQKLEEENRELKQKLNDALMSNANIMKELLQARESRDYMLKEWKTREEIMNTEISRLNDNLRKPRSKESASQASFSDIHHVLTKDKETQCELDAKRERHDVCRPDGQRAMPELMTTPPQHRDLTLKENSVVESSTQTEVDVRERDVKTSEPCCGVLKENKRNQELSVSTVKGHGLSRDSRQAQHVIVNPRLLLD